MLILKTSIETSCICHILSLRFGYIFLDLNKMKPSLLSALWLLGPFGPSQLQTLSSSPTMWYNFAQNTILSHLLRHQSALFPSFPLTGQNYRDEFSSLGRSMSLLPPLLIFMPKCPRIWLSSFSHMISLLKCKPHKCKDLCLFCLLLYLEYITISWYRACTI